MASVYESTKMGAGVQPRVGLHETTVTFEYKVASVVTGDVLKCCKIPKGAYILDGAIATDKSVGTGGTVKLGFNDGSTNDDDALIASTQATAALFARMGAVAGMLAKMAADAYLYLTLGVSSGAATDLTIKGWVKYTVDP